MLKLSQPEWSPASKYVSRAPSKGTKSTEIRQTKSRHCTADKPDRNRAVPPKRGQISVARVRVSSTLCHARIFDTTAGVAALSAAGNYGILL